MPPPTAGQKKIIKQLKNVKGIGNAKALILVKAGVKSLSELQNASEEKLEQLGLDSKLIMNVRKSITPILLRGERSITARYDQFVFDGQNHRFIGQKSADSCRCRWEDFDKKTAIQKIENTLWEYFKVPELFGNMKKNGITFQDRIVVAEWPEPSDKADDKKKYVVLEGNRRLCAFRRLKSERDVPQMVIDQLEKIEAVEMIYTDRKELLERAKAMMAVRHLCGLEEWGAFAQAVMKKQAVEKYGSSAAAANHLGISTRNVNQDLEAISLFEDIQNLENKPLISSDFASCIELCNPQLRKWLGTEHKYANSTDTIGNTDNMKILLRKWKGIPDSAKEDDKKRLSGGAIAFRPIKKLLKSDQSSIISDWENGEITLDQAIMQISAKDIKGSWPGNVNAAIETIESLNGTKLKSMKNDEVSKLHMIVETSKEQISIRETLMKAEVESKGTTNKKLKKMCEERGLDTPSKKKDLQNRLIKGMND